MATKLTCSICGVKLGSKLHDLEKHQDAKRVSSKYNGWQNYETWAVKLWLDNDEGTYSYWRDRTREIWDASETGGNQFAADQSQRARIALAEALKDTIQEEAPDLGASMFADLLNAAIGEVDWYELANAFLQDAEIEEYAANA